MAQYFINVQKLQFLQSRSFKNMTMQMDDIYKWIIARPNNYPGKHLEPQPRTDPSYKPLQPRAQFTLIFKATGQYIREQMQNGKGVNFKNLGGFAAEVYSDIIKPTQLSNFDISKELQNQRLQRKHIHQIRPCFVPQKRFQTTLLRYPGKEEITKPKSQHSIYQRGFSMIFCNPVPIAQSCSLSKQTVICAHQAFSKAVTDLVDLGHSFQIKFHGLVSIRVVNRDLTYKYSDEFINRLNKTEYEQKMKKSNVNTSEHWISSYDKKWQQSTLNSLFQKPNANDVKNFHEKGLALKIMSLDLNSVQNSKNKNQ